MSSESDLKKAHGRANARIRRFVRLLTGTEAGALGKLLWNTPDFQPRINPHEHTIDFIFSLRFSQPLKRYRPLPRLLFGPGYKSWEKAFSSAYSRLPYGDKKLKQSMANRFRALFLEGLRLWLHDAWSLKGVPKNTTKRPSRRTELEAFNEDAKIKRNQPDPRIAMWAARRESQFLAGVSTLRKNLTGRVALMDSSQFRREIAKVVPYKTFVMGLQRITHQPNPNQRAFFTATWASNKSMAHAMLAAEMEAKGWDLRKISLRTYLAEGKKLLAALSSLPK